MVMNKLKGFTLIELMVTVAIIAILVAIAYPSYQDSVLKTRRATGQSDLIQVANYMERFFTESGTYVGATIASSGITNDSYGLAITVQTATNYTLTATATGPQTADTACTPMTVTNTNITTPASGCW
jgi:type IV pilus assembly protein PilE